MPDVTSEHLAQHPSQQHPGIHRRQQGLSTTGHHRSTAPVLCAPALNSINPAVTDDYSPGWPGLKGQRETQPVSQGQTFHEKSFCESSQREKAPSTSSSSISLEKRFISLPVERPVKEAHGALQDLQVTTESQGPRCAFGGRPSLPAPGRRPARCLGSRTRPEFPSGPDILGK